MPRRKSIPKYRLHRQSGQAIVTLSDGLGNRRDVLLGKRDTAESRVEYARVIAEWEANGRRLPASKPTTADLTVNELALAYWKFAESYYGPDRGRGTTRNIRDALRGRRQPYGHTPAAEYGPLALKACRAEMVKKGWSRTYVNAQVDRLRRMFRWAASEQLVPAAVYGALKTVEGLRRGRTDARETKKVKPVVPEQIDATLPFMPPAVQAMVNLQLLTGSRPDEVCRLRPLDLDMSNPACWAYRPGSDQGEHGEHKTAHHDQDRLILIGPRAQEVLRPYLGTKLDAYCFSPVESEWRRSLRRRALVSASADTTLLVWSIRGRDPWGPAAEAALSAEAVKAEWDELASGDAAAAYRAVCALTAAPGQALPLLRERLAKAWAVDEKQVARWLADTSTATNSRCARRRGRNWRSSDTWSSRRCGSACPASRRRRCAGRWSCCWSGCKG
jgi:integrase